MKNYTYFIVYTAFDGEMDIIANTDYEINVPISSYKQIIEIEESLTKTLGYTNLVITAWPELITDNLTPIVRLEVSHSMN